MNPVSMLLKMIPGVRDYIGLDGSLSDGSHKFAMQVATGDAHATLNDGEKSGHLKSIPTELKAALNEKLHVVQGATNVLQAKVTQPYLTIGEHFVTEIELPKGLKEGSRPRVILHSPIRGPIDIEEEGLAKVSLFGKTDPISRETSWYKIQIESKAPIPSFIKLGDKKISTQFKFPLTVVVGSETIAKANIEIGPSKIDEQGRKFIEEVAANMEAGKEFTTKSFPVNSAEPLLTVSYSKTPDAIGGKLLINSYRKDGTQELSWHLTDEMNGVTNKWGGAVFKHDIQGQKSPEDGIINGRFHGPNFKSGAELVRFVLANTFRQSVPYGLQRVEAPRKIQLLTQTAQAA